MNYKKLFKSKRLRFTILKALNFIPDKLMVKLQYRIKTGRCINFENPTRFTEKLQLYKLYYHNPIMHQCVDKYEVRKYVENKGLGYILNPLIGVYDKAEDIDFPTLPVQCVIKSTTGGGGCNVYICKDLRKLNVSHAISKFNSWLNMNNLKFTPGREWAYKETKNRIIIENFIESNEEEGGLVDYKFFCFNGKCHFMYVIADRVVGKVGGLGIYTPDYVRLNVRRADENLLERDLPKPENFNEMLAIAEKLAEDFPHVRVDLYDVKGKIIFGELTFYDGSGYMPFDPDSFDIQAGSYFDVEQFMSIRVDNSPERK